MEDTVQSWLCSSVRNQDSEKNVNLSLKSAILIVFEQRATVDVSVGIFNNQVMSSVFELQIHVKSLVTSPSQISRLMVVMGFQNLQHAICSEQHIAVSKEFKACTILSSPITLSSSNIEICPAASSCVMVHHRTPYVHSCVVQWNLAFSMKTWWLEAGTNKTYCCEKAEMKVTHCRSPAWRREGEKFSMCRRAKNKEKTNQSPHSISLRKHSVHKDSNKMRDSARISKWKSGRRGNIQTFSN